jgi:hypothetical protein
MTVQPVAMAESRVELADRLDRFAAQCILLHPDRYTAKQVVQALRDSYPVVCKVG